MRPGGAARRWEQAHLPVLTALGLSLLLAVPALALAQDQTRFHTNVDEPAHYHADNSDKETSSASTRQEDVMAHVQAEPGTLDKQAEVQAHAEAQAQAKDNVHTAKVASTARRYVNTQDGDGGEWARQHWADKIGWGMGGSHKMQVPQLELVVARDSEKLDWLTRVPSFWQITVLNRGPQLVRPEAKKWNVMDLQNIYSDSQAFAHFLVVKYDQLAEYTVFSPGKPLQRNGHFMELLQAPTRLGTVQALSGRSMGQSSKLFATDRISTRTLNSVLTHDPDSVNIAKWFSKDYNLTWGQNLAKKYFDMIGLEHWMHESQEIGSSAPGGMLGFERSRATRHPKFIYENLLSSITTFGGNMHVVERLWLMLFAGSDFLDVPT